MELYKTIGEVARALDNIIKCANRIDIDDKNIIALDILESINIRDGFLKIRAEKEEKMSNEHNCGDPVNHPVHYQSKSGLETIDVIKAFTEDLSGIQAVCTANALKYTCRWHKKNGVEDIDKAMWYLNKLKETICDDNEDGDAYVASLRDTLMRHFIDEQRPMVVHMCGIEDFVKYLSAYGFWLNGVSEEAYTRNWVKISRDNLEADLVFVPNGKNVSVGLAHDFEQVWTDTDKKPLYWS